MIPIPSYRFRPSPLHAARAGASASFCAALALTGLLFDSPVILGAGLLAILIAGLAAGVGAELARAAVLAVPLALLVAVINPLVYQEGATVLVRGWSLFGFTIDITLEAFLAGLLAGVRVLVTMLAFALYSACVDPDEMLRLLRRFSYRSALTAALATRMVPLLARDARRRAEAARCRPAPPTRRAVARAALAGSLDRALDTAAALEVRGYSRASRPINPSRAWSRHDVAVASSAAVIAVGLLAAAVAGAGKVLAYPRLEIVAGTAEWALAALLLCGALMPFAVPGARLGTARA